VVLAVLVAGISLGACSSSGSSKAAPGATGSTSTTSRNPAGGSGTAAGGVRVDLVITGDRPVTIKGTKGRCDMPSNATLSSGYEFTAADYPVLGAGGVFNVAGPQRAIPGQIGLAASIKVLIADVGFLDTDGSGITVSADRKTVALDADLSGSTAGTPSVPGTPLHDHVTGTIACS
jgi:hypothetical protein